MFSFLRQNLRFLGAGLLLTLFSSFGQTWFISLFAGHIRAAHGLSDGGWGSLYSLATLASAGLIFLRGGLADTMPLGRLAPIIAIGLAASGVAFAFAPSVWVLGLALFGLRFCGQGMFPQIALTAIGRWFRARRGRAVSIVQLGHPLGEAVLPLTVLAISAVIGWQMTWQ
jgi:sugar phosphate permease